MDAGVSGGSQGCSRAVHVLAQQCLELPARNGARAQAEEVAGRQLAVDDGEPILLAHGDQVTVEMTPYDLTKGRIVYRGR